MEKIVFKVTGPSGIHLTGSLMDLGVDEEDELYDGGLTDAEFDEKLEEIEARYGQDSEEEDEDFEPSSHDVIKANQQDAEMDEEVDLEPQEEPEQQIQQEEPKEPVKEEVAPAQKGKNKKKKNIVELKGGLSYKVIKKGSGKAVAKSGSKVGVKYVGMFKDGKIFDNNVQDRKAFVFNLGEGEVIEGWDKGVLGMKVGSKRKLFVPSDMAYGEEGADTIPPNTDLTFVIQVESIK